ncbi:MAG: MFS transporter [Anaerolineae bacterium]|nr:MFS transporter [Anaerolineae bacterium]
MPDSGRLERWVLIASVLASSMAFIDSTALNVALPTLQTEFNMGGSQLLWVVNAYALFLSALILVGGSLGDHYGRKRVFMAGISLFAVASMACGLAPNVAILIAARAVQGIGGALMVPGSLAILSASVAPERRGTAIGTWSTFSTLTTLLGPLLGGWLAGQGLWRVVFFVNLPLAVMALYILNRYVPENRDETMSPRLDYPGAFLATIGLAGLTYGFIEAPNFGFGDPRILLALVGGVVALIVFIVLEARSDHPMVPLRLFRSPTFSGANALTLFLYAALSASPFFLSLNLIQVQGYAPDKAGLVLLPFGILLALISRRAGKLADKIGPRPLLTVGPALAGVGFFMLALPGLTTGPDSYWTTYFPAVILMGIGMGITVAPLTTAVMTSAPAESTGTASGINNAVARTAGVLAIAILGAVALVTFSQSLDAKAENLNLPANALAALRLEAPKLADAAVPAGLDAAAEAGVETAIKQSFVETFNLITVIAAGLAWLSALLAYVMVGRRK